MSSFRTIRSLSPESESDSDIRSRSRRSRRSRRSSGLGNVLGSEIRFDSRSDRRMELERLANDAGLIIPEGMGLRRIIRLLIDSGVISEEVGDYIADVAMVGEKECLKNLKNCEQDNKNKKKEIGLCEDRIAKLKKDAEQCGRHKKRKIIDCFPNECDFIKSCNRRRKTRQITNNNNLTDKEIKEIIDDIPSEALVIGSIDEWIGQIDKVIVCLDRNLRSWKRQYDLTWHGNTINQDNIVDNINNGIDAEGNMTKDGGIFSLSGQRTNNILRCFGGKNLPKVGYLPTEPICTPEAGWRVVYNKKLNCDPNNFHDDDDDACISLPPKQIVNKEKCRKEWICPRNEKIINKFKMEDCFDDNGCYKLPEINICNASNDFKFICPKPNVSVETLCKGINWSDLVSKQRAECIHHTPCLIYSKEIKYEAINWLINTGSVINGLDNITTDLIIELQVEQFQNASSNVPAEKRYNGLCCNKICYNPDLYIDCDEIIENQIQFKALSNKFECLICLVRDYTKYSNGKVISGSIPGGNGWTRDQIPVRDSCGLPDEETLWKAVGSVLPEETEKSLLETKAIKLSMNARSKCELINSDFAKAEYWADYLDYIEKAQCCANSICDIKYLICLVNEKNLVIKDIVKCLRELIGELYQGLRENMESNSNVELWFEIQTNINRVFCIVKDLYESVDNKQSEFEYNSIFSQVDDVYYIWGGVQASQTESITQIGNIESAGDMTPQNAELSSNINLNLSVKQVENFDVSKSLTSDTITSGQTITKKYLDNLEEFNKLNIYNPLYLPHKVMENGSWVSTRIYNDDLYQVVPIVTPCPNYDCLIDIAENGILIHSQTMDLRKPSAFQVYQQFLNEGNVVSDPTNIIKTPYDIETNLDLSDETNDNVIDGDDFTKLGDYRWTQIQYSVEILNPLQSTNNSEQDIEFPSISPLSLIISGDNAIRDAPNQDNATLPFQIQNAPDVLRYHQKGIPCITWNAKTLTQFCVGEAHGKYLFKEIICVPVAIASSGISSSDANNFKANMGDTSAQISTVTFGKPNSIGDKKFVYRSQNNILPSDGNIETISPATPEGVGYYIFPGYDKPDQSDIAFENFPGYLYPGIRSRKELLCVGTLHDEILETYKCSCIHNGYHVSDEFDKHGFGLEAAETCRENKFAVKYGPSAEQFKEHYPELFLCDTGREVLGWSETFKSLGFATTTFDICKHTNKPEYSGKKYCFHVDLNSAIDLQSGDTVNINVNEPDNPIFGIVNDIVTNTDNMVISVCIYDSVEIPTDFSASISVNNISTQITSGKECGTCWKEGECTDEYPIIKSYPPLGYDENGNVVQAYSRPGHVLDDDDEGFPSQTYTAWPPNEGDRIPASLVKYLLNPIPKIPQCGVVTNMSEEDPFINIANTLVGRGNYLMTNNKSSNRFERAIIRSQGDDTKILGTGVNDRKVLGGFATSGAASIDSLAIESVTYTGGMCSSVNEVCQNTYNVTETSANKQFAIIQKALLELQRIIDQGGSGDPSIPGFPDPGIPGGNPSLVCGELLDDVFETTSKTLIGFDPVFSKLFNNYPLNRRILCRKARKEYLCKPMICDKGHNCVKKNKSRDRECKKYRSRNYYDDSSESD